MHSHESFPSSTVLELNHIHYSDDFASDYSGEGDQDLPCFEPGYLDDLRDSIGICIYIYIYYKDMIENRSVR